MPTDDLDDDVRQRARNRCEYCRIPEAAFAFKHVLDHIRARQHRGPTTSRNLALCCNRCNLCKGPNLTGIDPKTGRVTRLFNPRRDRWGDHFRWRRAMLIGKTPVGRATVEVLQINAPDRVDRRRRLMDEGAFWTL
jgi:hypothetical protein